MPDESQQSQVALALDGDRQEFEPSEVLSGRFWLAPEAFGKEIQRIELSVGWRTEGKGDEDLGIHHFEAQTAEENSIDPLAEHRFETTLPFTPLSYDGHLLKLQWRVLVRVNFLSREQWVGEVPFWLGDVHWPLNQEELEAFE